jgi:ribosome-associated protein
VDESLSKDGYDRLHREGSPESGWMLLDFGDVICHIFGPMEREYYQLERLWGAAPRLMYVE